MLEAARRNDWDTMVAEERRCRELVDELRAGAPAPLSSAEQAEKHRILCKLLADDAEIRNLAQPWLRHLETVLSAPGNNRKLDGSYGRLP
jgi:flagellar protein FliT